MRTVLLVLLVGCFVAGCPPHSTHAQSPAPATLSATARIDSAQAAWRADRPSIVIEILRPLAATDTASALVYRLLGQSHQSLRQHGSAAQAFESALERGGASASLLTTLGRSYQAQGQLDRAEAAQKRALALDTTGRARQIRLRLAAVHESQRDWPRAVDRYRELHEADTTNLFVRTRLARAEAKRGHTEEALRHYRAVHRQRPYDADIALALTRLLTEQKRYRAALAVTRRTLPHRDWPALWRRQGDLAFQIDSLALAERAYENTLAHGDSTANTLQRLGITRVGQNKNAAALPVLQASYRRDTTRAATSFYLGTAYRGVDSLGRARAAYERAVDQASEGTLADALTQLAPTYNQLGHLPDALDAYRLVLRLQPERKQVYFHLATLYDEHYKDKTVAARYYRRYLAESTRAAPRLKSYAKRRLNTLMSTLHLQSARPLD